MCAKFHCPTSADTLFSKDVEEGIHSSSVTESQNSQLTLVKLYFKIIYDGLDADVRCPEGSSCWRIAHSRNSKYIFFPIIPYSHQKLSCLKSGVST